MVRHGAMANGYHSPREAAIQKERAGAAVPGERGPGAPSAFTIRKTSTVSLHADNEFNGLSDPLKPHDAQARRSLQALPQPTPRPPILLTPPRSTPSVPVSSTAQPEEGGSGLAPPKRVAKKKHPGSRADSRRGSAGSNLSSRSAAAGATPAANVDDALAEVAFAVGAGPAPPPLKARVEAGSAAAAVQDVLDTFHSELRRELQLLGKNVRKDVGEVLDEFLEKLPQRALEPAAASNACYDAKADGSRSPLITPALAPPQKRGSVAFAPTAKKYASVGFGACESEVYEIQVNLTDATEGDEDLRKAMGMAHTSDAQNFKATDTLKAMAIGSHGLGKKKRSMKNIESMRNGEPFGDDKPVPGLRALEGAVDVIIILSCILAVVEVEYISENHTTHDFFKWSQVALCGIFGLEVLVRLAAYKVRFFVKGSIICWWNLFDCVCVGVQSVDTALQFVKLEEHMLQDALQSLRIVQILRLVRACRGVPQLRMLITSILRTIGSLFWTSVLFFALTYITAVYLAFVVVTRSGRSRTEDHLLDNLFGSFPRALLTVLQCATGGIDWNDVAEPLMVYVSKVSCACLVGYVVFTILAMMNVIAGMFIDGVMRRAQQEKDSSELARVTKLFQQLDIDNSGSLTWEEIETQMQQKAVVERFAALGIDTGDAGMLFKLLDTDKSGTIDCSDFLRGVARLRGTARAIDVMMLLRQLKNVEAQVASSLGGVSSAHSSIFASNDDLLDAKKRAQSLRKSAEGK
eukprot:TRINITY_DN6806_c0_g1_i1.p1 TRINITY_DN6806_c0_g1~~TRINITY_DN6806_c0_g1_i1.p1  ORF type:complete len:748 (+),score=143.19 TRINITY_DN6806_c0_g1_i1:117-2360(+)